jgi:glutamine amidotransferase-like uncharacterized protein
MKAVRKLPALILLALAAQGCGGGDDSGMLSGPTGPYPAGQRRPDTNGKALVYAGRGTAVAEANVYADILAEHGVESDMADEYSLPDLSLDELAAYDVLVWPGGYATQQSNALDVATRERVREAVRERGLGFVGVCAGAFIAGVYGNLPEWGLRLIPSDFPYYYLEQQGVSAAMVNLTFSDGSQRDIVWYGGPQLNGFGQVVARYPNGDSAIGQNWSGAGLVVLSAGHPDAPESWRSSFGLSDSDGSQVDHELAWKMASAAIERTPMPGF